jgi:thioesterase domain-containing protein/acyl-CoA synthetase (AMP-forming)/AMP-acid ligase II
MIYSIFKDSVSRYPGQLAFVLEDGQQFTYQEADVLINKIAHYLYSNGVRQGQRIGFMTTLGSLHPFIFYALDKLNATYFPLDIEVPLMQLDSDLKKLKLPILIIDEDLDIKLDPTIGTRQHCISQKVFIKSFENYDDQKNPLPEIIYDPKIPVYGVSSSGTQDRKKWMEVGGAGLAYWARTEQAQFQFQPGHKVLGKCSDAYDASISEKLRALISGGTLHMISNVDRKDIDFIITYCKKHGITELLLIASQLKGDDLEKKIERLADAGVKYLYVTGDTCNPILQGFCEKHGIILVNAYGSSEETFGISTLPVNGLRLTDSKGNAVVPIGYPEGKEIEVFIVDGILHVKSPYLIEQYIDDEEKTASAFPYIDVKGEKIRVFNSGDHFVEHVINDKKYLEFKGRVHASNESKVIGVKVDMHDTEQLIKKYAEEDNRLIDVCVVSKNVDGDTKLVAYMVTKEGFNIENFLLSMSRWLKPTVIPLYVSIDKLPVRAVNGKIDTTTLENKEDKPEEYLLAKATPNPLLQNTFNNATTQDLEKIWEMVLKVKPTSHDDNFVLWGGDSIRCKRMHALINQRIDPTFEYRHLMSLETITIRNIYLKLMGKINEKTVTVALIQPLNQPRHDAKKNVFIFPDLLGNGGTQYLHLARHFLRGHDVNLVGLSDPGIYDEAIQPQTLEEAVNRYVTAILNTQPKGPYQLMGYSYGCLLAYHAAHRLQSLGHQVSHLHLIDGFPSGFYHQLSQQQHAQMLSEFSKNIVNMLNGEYYGEKVSFQKLPDLNKHNKNTQVHHIIDALICQVKNDLSRCMLKLAKKHLLFMLSDIEKKRISIQKVKFYVSSSDQPYHRFIDQIPGLNKNSPDYIFYYWNQYIYRMQRSGDVAPSDHLSLVKEPRGAELLFQYGHDPFKEFNVFAQSSYTERVAYISLNKSDDYSFMICNIMPYWSEKIRHEFLENNLCSNVVCVKQSDKLHITRKPEDIIFEDHHALIATVSKEHWAKIKAYCTEQQITITQLPRKSSVLDRSSAARESNATPMDISIDFHWNRALFMRFYFHATSNTAEIIKSLVASEYAKEMSSTQTADQLTLMVNFIHFGSSFEAMDAVKKRMTTMLPDIMPYVLARSKAQSIAETKSTAAQHVLDRYQEDPNCGVKDGHLAEANKVKNGPRPK